MDALPAKGDGVDSPNICMPSKPNGVTFMGIRLAMFIVDDHPIFSNLCTCAFNFSPIVFVSNIPNIPIFFSRSITWSSNYLAQEHAPLTFHVRMDMVGAVSHGFGHLCVLVRSMRIEVRAILCSVSCMHDWTSSCPSHTTSLKECLSRAVLLYLHSRDMHCLCRLCRDWLEALTLF